MKFYETHFEEYITENNRVNLHPKLDKIYEKFPKSLDQLKNLIFFGPNGTGKYTQMFGWLQNTAALPIIACDVKCCQNTILGPHTRLNWQVV